MIGPARAGARGLQRALLSSRDNLCTPASRRLYLATLFQGASGSTLSTLLAVWKAQEEEEVTKAGEDGKENDKARAEGATRVHFSCWTA